MKPMYCISALNGADERWLRRDVHVLVDRGRRGPAPAFLSRHQSPGHGQARSARSLRKKVDELTITDELTGLSNRRATLQALAIQVTRSRRYGNRLTLGAVGISYPGDPTVRLPDVSILSFSHYLRERLRWSDTIGRYEEQTFLLVMPETGEKDAMHLLDQI